MSKIRQTDDVMNQQRDCLRSNKQLNQPTKKLPRNQPTDKVIKEPTKKLHKQQQINELIK